MMLAPNWYVICGYRPIRPHKGVQFGTVSQRLLPSSENGKDLEGIINMIWKKNTAEKLTSHKKNFRNGVHTYTKPDLVGISNSLAGQLRTGTVTVISLLDPILKSHPGHNILKKPIIFVIDVRFCFF